MLDHTPGAIIVYHADNRQIVPHGSVKLHGIEAEGAIAINHDHRLVRSGSLGCQGKGNPGSKTAELTLMT